MTAVGSAWKIMGGVPLASVRRAGDLCLLGEFRSLPAARLNAFELGSGLA